MQSFNFSFHVVEIRNIFNFSHIFAQCKRLFETDLYCTRIRTDVNTSNTSLLSLYIRLNAYQWQSQCTSTLSTLFHSNNTTLKLAILILAFPLCLAAFICHTLSRPLNHLVYVTYELFILYITNYKSCSVLIL